MSRLTRKTNGLDYFSYCRYIEKTNELFGRGEKPLKSEEYYKEEPYKMEDSYYLEDAMNRLGKIEDLMDEYNINSIEELENIFGSKVVAGGFRSSGKSIVAKGMFYNILSEELGCSLEVVFKALKDGIIDFENNEHRYIHLRNNGKYVLPSNCWIFHTFHFSYVFKLSDYQKTWWLKGEKE